MTLEEEISLIEKFGSSEPEIVKSLRIKAFAQHLAESDLSGDEFNMYFNRLKKVEYGK